VGEKIHFVCGECGGEADVRLPSPPELRTATKALDVIAAWETFETNMEQRHAREALVKIRGGDGRPRKKTTT
jgi:hypothetical protein